MVFDSETRDIYLTTGIQNAANRPFTHIKGEELFGKSEPPYCEKKTRFARNLDWLIPALGPQTVVVVYPSKNNTKAAATISWGGYIGGFSGINSEGVSCGLTLAPASLQAGTPNQLILRQTLELSDNLQSAIDTVENCISASSMNMMIVARDGMAILELDPERKKGGQKGPAFIHRH
jgi:predicted choloylglycine hydrolase